MKRAVRRIGRRAAGFTLVELAVAVGLFTLVLLGATIASNAGYGAFRASSARTDVDTTGRRALERAREVLSSAVRESFDPDPAGPLGSHEMTFELAQPFGAVGPPQVWRLRMDTDASEVHLVRDPGEPQEHRVVLARGVSAYFEGETPNLNDDNGNGLIDERGFHLHREGDLLTLRLTLEGMDPDGRAFLRSFETAVRLRN